MNAADGFHDSFLRRAELSNALLHDRAGTRAILLAFFGGFATLIAWANVLSASGVRGVSPFCLPLLAAFVWWFVSLSNYDAWALRRLRLTIVLWPALALVAALLAHAGIAVPGRNGPSGPDDFGFWCFAGALGFSAGAWFMLRRSALPGGTRPLVPLPLSPQRPVSALLDTSAIEPLDALGNVSAPSAREIAAAQPVWLAPSSLVVSGSLIDGLVCGLTAGPAFAGREAALYALLAAAVAALAVTYVRSVVAFGRRPNLATRHGILVVFELALAFFGACALLDVVGLATMPFGPNHGGAYLVWGCLCVALAVGPALALGNARRKLAAVDLTDLAAHGYRAVP